MFHPVKKEVSNKTIRLPDTLLEKMELLAVQDLPQLQIPFQPLPLLQPQWKHSVPADLSGMQFR